MREIKKAQNRFELQVDSDLPIDDFLEINELTFKRKGKRLTYRREIMYGSVKPVRKEIVGEFFLHEMVKDEFIRQFTLSGPKTPHIT